MRSKMCAAMKARWADPEQKAKMLAGGRKGAAKTRHRTETDKVKSALRSRRRKREIASKSGTTA